MIDIDKIKQRLKNVDFYRIFIQEYNQNFLLTVNGKVEQIQDKKDFGINIFFVKNKRSYFFATNDPEKVYNFSTNFIKKLDKNIDYNPRESNIKDNITLGKKSTLDLENLAKQYITATKPKPKSVNRKGIYNYIEETRTIISENTEIILNSFHTYSMLFNTVKENNKLREDYIRIGLPTGLNEITSFLAQNEDNYKKAVEKLKYKENLKGKYDILLAPDVVDLLAHEAIGHATESDLVYNNYSVLNNKLNKNIGPDFITLYDDPTEPNLFGNIVYDDEGFKAKKKTLIKNGVLTEYILNDRYSQLMNLENNGGARAQSYKFYPIPRMTNTHFKPGNTKLDDIYNENKNFIFLSGFRGGQTNPTTGIFQFGVKEATLYEKGKEKEKYVNTMFSGNILDVLYKIKTISKERGAQSPGFCGKDGQTAFVSGKDPYILLKDIYLG